ncbi:MAG TPA: chromate efflux transporter [Roseiflexaceae bacterium]
MELALDESTERATLGELARYFLRLGFTAFGGPAAHIAIMEDDVVARRRWLTRAHFMDMLAATQLVPGPNSTEMAIHVGYLQQGLPGLVIAGACFILPAFLIVLALSIGYVAYGALPAVGALFYGIQPVIVAIVVQATYRLGRTAWRSNAMRALGVLAFVVALIAPFDPVWVIVAGGLAGVALAQGLPAGSPLLALLLRNPWSDRVPDNSTPIARIVRMGGDYLYGAIRVNLFNPSNPWSLATVALVQAAADSSLWRLALFFLKVGATLMGSGYLLISYLQNDLVSRYGWLTPRQLVDAIAVGQMTPGPVFTTAAFVGYVVRAGPANDVVRGLAGAAVCALAIFLPSFVIVALMGPLLPRLRGSTVMRAFLDGVNAAVVGTIAATVWSLFRAAAIDVPHPTLAVPLAGAALDLPAAALALGATALLLRDRAPNSTVLIGVGAALGLVAQALAGGL